MTKLRCSLLANVLFVLILGILAFRHYQFRHQPPLPRPPDTYNIMRSNVQESLEVTSKDVLFVGTSLTEGFPVTELYGPSVKNRGIGGNVTGQMLERIGYLADSHPRIILLEAGINDLHFDASPDSVVHNIARLIDIVRDRSPKTKIVIQSLFPVDEKRDDRWKGLQILIIETNSKLLRLTISKGVDYLDVFTSLGGSAGLDNSFTADGLHLNYNGYTAWGNIVKPIILEDSKIVM